MNQILSDGEIGALFDNHDASWRDYARAIESAVLAKLNNSEPVAWLYKSEDSFDAGQWLVSYDKINRREIKPLYLHPPAPSAVEWQPIETAPKDGTYVLVATEHGSWVAKHEAVFQSDNPWRSMMLNHDSINREYRTGRPTHWKHIPKPPVAAARSE